MVDILVVDIQLLHCPRPRGLWRLVVAPHLIKIFEASDSKQDACFLDDLLILEWCQVKIAELILEVFILSVIVLIFHIDLL